ncbi:protein broad-minded isoform X2 [Salmo salar]|uniref:Protein broad-minded isoform X2 n=1 Tax=Salmo salar TaxID=8030 RepID=A0ABM3CYK1_SALSA|nr:protein broad-minded-like isoform X2 [Salmo salar]
MYNTSEGLQVLRLYGLHECIAAAWKKMSSLSERDPTPGSQSHPWHVLSGAAEYSGLGGDFPELEPAELFCHSESPAAPPAYSRFTKKLQARPCDKFGYGVRVTQVAATAPGVVALHSSVVHVHGQPSVLPPCWWELLGQQPLPNKAEYNLREMPISLTTAKSITTARYQCLGKNSLSTFHIITIFPSFSLCFVPLCHRI